MPSGYAPRDGDPPGMLLWTEAGWRPRDEQGKGWLPAGVSQNDLPDSAFIWLSLAYRSGTEKDRGKGRKLPVRGPDGKVSAAGWRAAWNAVHGARGGMDFSGGPSKEQCIRKLLACKPRGIDVTQPGKADAEEPAMEYKTLPFEALPQTDDLEPNSFAGYIASFHSVDAVGDMILPGAFRDTLPAFLSEGFIAWQHDWAQPIGKPTEAREDPRGLFIKARISDTAAGRDALTLLRDGVVKKLSIGYKTLEHKNLTEPEGRAILGDAGYDAAIKALPWHMEAIRGLSKLQLFEGSPVSVPANRNAVVTGVKEGHGAAAGLSVDDHFAFALCAQSDFLARLREIDGLRRKDGRELSGRNRARVVAMREALVEHLQTLDDFLASTLPAQHDDEDDGDATPSKGDPALVLAARQQLIRFQHLEAHLNGAL